MELQIRRDPVTFDPIFGVWRPDDDVGQLFPDGGRLLEQAGQRASRSATTTRQRVGVAILLLLTMGPVALVVLPILAWHWYSERTRG